jgi:hypothetical protein
MKKPGYTDLVELGMDEDQRIQCIGEKVVKERAVVGVVMDDKPGVLELYIEKLQQRFPGIRIGAKGKGPTPGCQWFKVAPPVASSN